MFTTPLEDRTRPQVENHIRSIEVQRLDALLRIEELLQKLVRSQAMDTLVAEAAEEMDPPKPKGKRR